MSVLADDRVSLLDRAFAAAPHEHSDMTVDVRGDLPAFVRGTYYWNGPSRFERGGVRSLHWLDGDGMVSALRIGCRTASFSNRFVRTARWEQEEAAGRPIFRRFGTRFVDDRMAHGMVLESAANVSVIRFAGTLLALGEQGLPWELDPASLATRGLYTFGGAINAVSPFSAHPHIDARTGDLFNFGVSFHPRQPSLWIYRFECTGRLRYRRRLALEWPCSVHDFALSDRFAIFYLSPYLLDAAALTAGATPQQSLRWEPDLGSRILVVDCDTGSHVATVPIEGRYCLHAVNAFEREGLLYVDVLELDRPVYDQYLLSELFADVGRGRPTRFIIDASLSRLVARKELRYDRAPDFAVVPRDATSRPYTWFVALGISATGQRGRKFFDELVVADWEADEPRVLRLPSGQYFAGEPTIVSNAATPAAAIVCPVFDTTRGDTRFVVLDAADALAGPVAELALPHLIPPAFHGVFCPEPHER